MKQLYYNFFVITLLTCVFYSCEENVEEVVSFPITLYASEISEVNDIRLFVKDTEIFDKTNIDNFVGSDPLFDLSSFDLTESISMVFNSMDSATFGVNPQKYSAHKTDEQFIFYSPNYMLPVTWKSLLLKHRSEQIPVPSSSGYQHAEKHVMLGYGSYTNFEICFLIYKIHEYSHIDNTLVLREYSHGAASNEFNEDFIHTLGTTDTLAIREIKIRFIKKQLSNEAHPKQQNTFIKTTN